MAVTVNMRHLEAHDVRLQGELSPEELDIDIYDEVEEVQGPLFYNLQVQLVEGGILAQGDLRLNLKCQCVRCLRPFSKEILLRNWTRLFPLEGEEAVAIVNDCVDLTPYLREDMLLEFPQHPLCDPDCGGLPKTSVGKPKNTSSTGVPETGSSAWNELNKLKF